MHLVELSVMEQRYQAVMAVVQDGWKVTEVADRLGVTRQAVHKWIARYAIGGLAALPDRSHNPLDVSARGRPESRIDPSSPAARSRSCTAARRTIDERQNALRRDV